MNAVQPDAAIARPRPRRRVLVILPAYNEAQRIGRLLDRIDDTLTDAAIAYLVVVVDDGSTDDTVSIVTSHATQMPIDICRHERNQGLGATIRDGLLHAAGLASERDILVTMDADDTHAPGLILRMVRMIAEGFDVVIASRYRPGSRTVGLSVSRRSLSWAGSLLFRLVFPTRGIRDFTCGYRAYRAAVIRDAEARYGKELFDQGGFQCMVDILLKLRKMDLIFGEVPFVLRYDLKRGGSKMHVGRTIRDTLALVARRRFGR